MEGSNQYVLALIPQIGIGFTAICTLIGVIIQVKNNNKNKSNENIIQTIDAKLDKLKEDSDKSDKEIKECVTQHHFRYYKDHLVMMMSRIESGYKPTDEEVKILYEQKETYNAMGGDSYVDRMFERLQEKHLI